MRVMFDLQDITNPNHTKQILRQHPAGPEEAVIMEYKGGSRLPAPGDIVDFSTDGSKLRIKEVIYTVNHSGNTLEDPLLISLLASAKVVLLSTAVVQIGTPQEMAELLRNNRAVEVTFRKKDNSIRVMKATLHKDVIEPIFAAADQAKQADTQTDFAAAMEKAAARLDSGLVTVWDLEAKDWRSFKFDSIISVEYPAADGNTWTAGTLATA